MLELYKAIAAASGDNAVMDSCNFELSARETER